jgi:hypothetical protein
LQAGIVDNDTLQSVVGVLSGKNLFKSPGQKASQILSVPANVADGETVTIGTDVFEVDIINTDSTDDTAGGVWNVVTDPLTVDLTGLTLDAGLVVGALIRIENEIMKCTNRDGHNGTFARARCGTAAAAHADALDIYTSDAHPALNIPVGLVLDLTPATFLAAIADEINSDTGAAGQSQDVTATVLDANTMIIIADAVGAVALATTVTLGGANNEWLGATMVGGAAAGIRRIFRAAYVPTAAAVTKDYFLVPLDFTPATILIEVRVTATGIPKAWDGGVTLEAGPPIRLNVTNGGATDWDVNDTVWITAIE